MKRLFSIVLCFLTILTITSTCFAATSTTTDKPLKTHFEKLKGYDYDKFTKEWSYYQAWSHKYTDAYVNIGIQLDGNSESQMPPYLYCWIRDEKNRESIVTVQKIYFLIGDDMFAFENLLEGEASSSALLGEGSKEFLEALSKANSVSIRLSFSTSNLDEEIPSKEYKTTLKAAAKALLDSNVWDYINDDWKSIASYYDPTKN